MVQGILNRKFQSGRHRRQTSDTEENIIGTKKIFVKDKQVSSRYFKETLDLNVLAIFLILKDQLHVAYLCCLWVPHNLIGDQTTTYEMMPEDGENV